MKKLLLSLIFAAVLLTVAACSPNGGSDGSPKSFTVEVVPMSGSSVVFGYTTLEETVGAALVAEGLIEGETSQYGLMVMVVNGITADYNVDGTYWAFYIDGEYAMTGVDSTIVQDGAVYAFKQEN